MKKHISRRDALKLLGTAAGAAALSNLPGRWSTPQLTAGVLPAHAESSPVAQCLVLIKNLVGYEPTGPVPAGSQQSWELKVGNGTGLTVSGIEVEDQLPTAVESPSIGSATHGLAQIDGQGLVTWTIPALLSGEGATLRIDFTFANVNADVENVASITQPAGPDACPTHMYVDRIPVRIV